MESYHIPVLLKESIDALNVKPNGIYVDATLGGGGHAFSICKQLGENGKLIGIDQDIDAINAASKRLERFQKKTLLVNDNFKNIKKILEELNIKYIDGVIIDLGVSSHQLDEGERGFSYQHDAPLDMRMDRNSSLTAHYIVNNYSKEDLTDIIFKYGEEKWSKRIVEFIIEHRAIRPINTTNDLTDIIKKAIPAAVRKDGPHPAKRTFQAIRIAVNRELEILDIAINDFIDILNSGARMAVITFHSLEDRIVKRNFVESNKGCECPPDFPICICNKKPKVKRITRKPLIASKEELSKNNRARSAKLRVIEKL